MKSIKLAIMMMAFVSGTSTIQAQGRKGAQEPQNRQATTEKRAQRLAVEMGLDDNDAARFTEIYTRHANQLSELRQQKATPAENRDKAQQARTDAEVDAQMKAQFEQRRAAAELESTYYNDLRTVLSARQAKRVMQGNGRMGGMMMQRGPQMGMQRGMQRAPQMGMQRGGMMRGGMHRDPQMAGSQYGMMLHQGGQMSAAQRGPQMGMHRGTFAGMQPGTHGTPRHKMSKKEMKKARKAYKKAQKKMQKQMEKARKGKK